MIREALESLVSGRSLSMEEAAAVMEEIMSGQAPPALLGGFLVALRLKGETEEEMAGMARVMREKALRVRPPVPVCDVVGTGGDGAHTFNISTAAALVACGAGLAVAKHGNRAMSSACGSADVLEALGVKIDLGPQGVERCLGEVGFGFMFAPAFHPAMKHAAPVRRELGIRTTFNVLGPLTNPAHAQAMLLGVADGALAPKMARVLALLGCRRALVVHGQDGLDEITLSGPTTVLDLKDGAISSYEIRPGELGLKTVPLSELKGGTPAENAAIMRDVLEGRPSPYREATLLNAAAALVAGGKARDLGQGLELARQSIDSGHARAKLEALARLSQSLA